MADIRVLVRRKPDRGNLQLYYVDPLTGEDIRKSARTDNPRAAERAAGEWQAELEERRTVSHQMSWEQFRVYYEDSHLAGRSRRTESAATTALNWFELAIGKPKQIDLVDSVTLTRLVTHLRNRKLSAASIACYSRFFDTVRNRLQKRRVVVRCWHERTSLLFRWPPVAAVNRFVLDSSSAPGAT